jgi:hypothetical protein
MKGIRHFLRDFTALAVKEHLRSQIEAREGPRDFTKNEIELVRFIREGSFDWAIYERAAETTRSGRLRPSSDERLRPRR